MQSKKLKLKSKNSGFTLIETLVAIFIFSFSILGIIVISSHGVGDVQYAKNRLIASYLAQEGIELTRNIRDTTVMGNTGWTDFVNLMIPTCQDGCSLDYTFWMNGGTPPFTSCVSPIDCLVYYDDSPGGKGYIQDSNFSATKFYRTLRAQDLSADELNIISEVSWTQGSSTTVYSVKAEENLFNWIL